jgi:hypothetical protein
MITSIERPATGHLAGANPHAASPERHKRPSLQFVLLLFLVVAVAGFMSRSHNSWYHASSKPAQLHISTGKTMASKATLHIAQPLLSRLETISLPQPEVHPLARLEEVAPHPSLHVQPHPQDRAPPSTLA